MRLLFLNGLFFFFPLWVQSSITGKEQYFLQIIEYTVPNFLFSTDPEEIKYQEKLLLPCTLVCKGWKERLDERFDFKEMEKFFKINHRSRKEFLSWYKKRMQTLKEPDYDYDSDHDDSWLTNQNNQISPYKVNDIFKDDSLQKYLDIPFLFSFGFQEKMKNELIKFRNEGCEKSLFYIKNGGLLSQSLLECMFKYIYSAADGIAIDPCADRKHQRLKLFVAVLSRYKINIFLQKKLSYMLKRKRYITNDVIVGLKCRMEISDTLLDYHLFLSSFINEHKDIQETQTESFFNSDVIEAFFAEYEEAFSKKDKTGKSFLHYLLPLVLGEKKIDCLAWVFIAFVKQKTKFDTQSFAGYDDKTQCREQFKQLLG
jgi:hypothetical protein